MSVPFGAVAQLARAPRSHRGGQGFDSPQLHGNPSGSVEFGVAERRTLRTLRVPSSSALPNVARWEPFGFRRVRRCRTSHAGNPSGSVEFGVAERRTLRTLRVPSSSALPNVARCEPFGFRRVRRCRTSHAANPSGSVEFGVAERRTLRTLRVRSSSALPNVARRRKAERPEVNRLAGHPGRLGQQANRTYRPLLSRMVQSRIAVGQPIEPVRRRRGRRSCSGRSVGRDPRAVEAGR